MKVVKEKGEATFSDFCFFLAPRIIKLLLRCFVLSGLGWGTWTWGRTGGSNSAIVDNKK